MVYLHLLYSSRLHAIDIKIVKFIAQRTAKHNRVLEISALRIFTLHHIHRASSSKRRRNLSLGFYYGLRINLRLLNCNISYQ